VIPFSGDHQVTNLLVYAPAPGFPIGSSAASQRKRFEGNFVPNVLQQIVAMVLVLALDPILPTVPVTPAIVAGSNLKSVVARVNKEDLPTPTTIQRQIAAVTDFTVISDGAVFFDVLVRMVTDVSGGCVTDTQSSADLAPNLVPIASNLAVEPAAQGTEVFVQLFALVAVESLAGVALVLLLFLQGGLLESLLAALGWNRFATIASRTWAINDDVLHVFPDGVPPLFRVYLNMGHLLSLFELKYPVEESSLFFKVRSFTCFHHTHRAFNHPNHT
jgi:hypothetical protein